MKLFKFKKKNGSHIAIPQNYIYSKIKKKKVRIIIKIFYLFLVLSLLAGLFYFVFFTEYFKIKKINFYGYDVVIESELRDIANDELSKKTYFLENNNLFIPFVSENTSNRIKDEIRIVKSTDVKKRFPNTLEISITEYSPAGIVCNNINVFSVENVVDDISSKCYYFDAYGTVYDDAPVILGELVLYVYNKGISVENMPYDLYQEEMISFMNVFKERIFSNSDIRFDYFEFLNEYSDIEILTKSGFKIFLSYDSDPKGQADSIKAVIEEQIKEDIVNLEYIDLRIKNRAYYKLKSIVPEEGALNEDGEPIEVEIDVETVQEVEE